MNGSLEWGGQAAAAEYSQVYLANDHILDHICTQLAAMRMGIPIPGPLSMQAGEETISSNPKIHIDQLWVFGQERTTTA